MNAGKNDSKRRMALISTITVRAASLMKKHGRSMNRPGLFLDLEKASREGTIDLEAMASASAENLLHDAIGIMDHIDRETGKITGHFAPLFQTKSKGNKNGGYS